MTRSRNGTSSEFDSTFQEGTCLATPGKRTVRADAGFTIVELLIVIVVIAILAAITIVSYNGITSQAKATVRAQDIAQWKKKAEIRKLESGVSCPDNYVFIYGNSALGTNDFCVMKYEAKNVSGVATSQASGAPWVSINQTDAITAATAAGGHLITEAEWMTIAADVLSVKYNWTGGAVGSGYIYQGHVNNNPASALAASTDDTEGLNGMTGGIGTTVGTNSQRTLLLSSGDTIWDFSGNVWEWTQQAIGVPTFANSQIGIVGDSAFSFREYTVDGLSFGNLPVKSRPATLSSLPGLTTIESWNSDQGIGRIYANYADSNTRGFMRGGNWDRTADAGVLLLNVAGIPSTGYVGTGFRVSQ